MRGRGVGDDNILARTHEHSSPPYSITEKLDHFRGCASRCLALIRIVISSPVAANHDSHRHEVDGNGEKNVEKFLVVSCDDTITQRDVIVTVHGPKLVALPQLEIGPLERNARYEFSEFIDDRSSDIILLFK